MGAGSGWLVESMTFRARVQLSNANTCAAAVGGPSALGEVRRDAWAAKGRRWHVAALLAVLAGLVLALAMGDTAVLKGLVKPFATVHGLGRTTALAGLLSVLLTVAASSAVPVLLAVDVLTRAALAAALTGSLTFAQPAEPGAGGADPAQTGTTTPLQSEYQFAVFGGGSISPRSDVFLKAPDGTDMTLHDIKWKAESLEDSPFYGFRGIYWTPKQPKAGVMIGFTHAKATAIRSQTVRQSGKRKGKEIPPEEPFEKTFRKLEFTHGLNFVTLNGLYRMPGLHRRILPYVGVGIGLMAPHAEAWRAGVPRDKRTIEVQFTGLAFQVLAGIEWRIFKKDRYATFTEYKYTYTTNEVDVFGGGLVTADIRIHQFIVGLSSIVYRPLAAVVP